MGDIWSNGHHTGVFLGPYQGKDLYISARHDGDGVFALGKVQKMHGIQIKYLTGGIFRRHLHDPPRTLDTFRNGLYDFIVHITSTLRHDARPTPRMAVDAIASST